MNMDIIFENFRGDLPIYGVADYLRCCAMCAMEAEISRREYIEGAIARGFNPGTAATCWAYVKRQG